MDNYTIDHIKNKIKSRVEQNCAHLFTLVDSSPFSNTYGCFDRTFWQYKIKDFPTGMSQESIYPLALAIKNNIFQNLSDFSHNEILNIIKYGAKFSLLNQNFNGSVDDYFPFEQAAGATAFSSFAIIRCIEDGYINLTKVEINLLKKRINWLSKNKESGNLSNHEALISLVLLKASKIFNSNKFYESSLYRINRLLSWRNNEGWFEEYGGLDIGYETLTFYCLNQIKDLIPELKNKLESIVSKQFSMIIKFIEPDGCLGGEIYSRGTWNCFTNGLMTYVIENENKQKYLEQLLNILKSRFIENPINIADDYIIQHHLWSDIETYELLQKFDLKINSKKNSKVEFPKNIFKIERYFPESGHIWVNHGNYCTHVSLNLGGVLRIYKDNKFIFQDTQNVLKIAKNHFSANWLNKDITFQWIEKNKLIIEGTMTKKKNNLLDTKKLIFLRIFMFYIGRFCPNLVRKLMQRILIYARPNRSRTFKRIIEFKLNGLEISDLYQIHKQENPIIIASSFSCSRHVIMSKIFHPYFLKTVKPKFEKYTKTEDFYCLKRSW